MAARKKKNDVVTTENVVVENDSTVNLTVDIPVVPETVSTPVATIVPPSIAKGKLDYTNMISTDVFSAMSDTAIGHLVKFDNQSAALVRAAIYFVHEHIKRWKEATGKPHVSPAAQKEATKYLRILWRKLVECGHDNLATSLVQAANLCGAFVKEVKTSSQETADGQRVQVVRPPHLWELDYAKTDHQNHVNKNKPNATKKAKDEDGNEITVTAYAPLVYNLELLIFKCTYDNILEDVGGLYWQHLGKFVKAFRAGTLTVVDNQLFIHEAEKSDKEKGEKNKKDIVRGATTLAKKLGDLETVAGVKTRREYGVKALSQMGIDRETLQAFLELSVKEKAPCVQELSAMVETALLSNLREDLHQREASVKVQLGAMFVAFAESDDDESWFGDEAIAIENKASYFLSHLNDAVNGANHNRDVMWKGSAVTLSEIVEAAWYYVRDELAFPVPNACCVLEWLVANKRVSLLRFEIAQRERELEILNGE